MTISQSDFFQRVPVTEFVSVSKNQRIYIFFPFTLSSGFPSAAVKMSHWCCCHVQIGLFVTVATPSGLLNYASAAEEVSLSAQ